MYLHRDGLEYEKAKEKGQKGHCLHATTIKQFARAGKNNRKCPFNAFYGVANVLSIMASLTTGAAILSRIISRIMARHRGSPSLMDADDHMLFSQEMGVATRDCSCKITNNFL